MAESNEVGDVADDALKYDTYEQYLDSQISQMDLYYLEDQDLARQLVELGEKNAVCHLANRILCEF
jgi:hypothetical protein